MAEIRAFRAIRYTQKAGGAEKNTCPPYDIINSGQRKSLTEKSEYNIVRAELPDGCGKYKKAASLLSEWTEKGILERDAEEGVYIYTETFNLDGTEKTVTSLLCLVKLYEFDEKIVLPHEDTLKKAKTDRFNLLCETNCNISPVYAIYAGGGHAVADIIGGNASAPPTEDFTDPEGVTHRLWKITDKKDIEAIRESFADKQLFIADGHHRYETALNYKKHLETQGEENPAAGYIMMALADMDDPGLVVLPTHRVIVNMKIDMEELKKKCSADFEISEYPDINDAERILQNGNGKTLFAMYSGGEGFTLLTARENVGKTPSGGRSAAYCGLGVSILHDYILEKALGIDKQNMADQINLRYVKSRAEAVERVRNGECAVAFIINPPKISEIKSVSLAGDKMPQKSTYFYPKLITGLTINALNGI